MPDAPLPPAPDQDEPISKKDQILALHQTGIESVEELAMLTQSRPSYVSGVLQEEGLGEGYFDLYTSTQRPMNVYSKYFAGKLGFRDVQTAEESVATLERVYGQFELAKDRAGQHHALQMALTMLDRARWTGKDAEAEPFRRWLTAHLGAGPSATEDQPAS